MKPILKLFISSLLLLNGINCYAQYPSFDWAKSMGPIYDTFSTSRFHENKCEEIAIDLQGNVYAVGTFSQTTDFDPGIGVYNLTPNFIGSASLSTYIVKLSSTGSFLWAKKLSTDFFGYYISLPNITIDKKNNVVVAGIFNATTDFNPDSSGSFMMTPVGGNNDPATYILKLSSNGDFIWAKQLGSAGGGESPTACATDSYQNIYTIGTFSSVMDMDPSATTANIFPLTGFGVYISKLDSNGNYLFGKALVGTDHVRGFSMAISSTNRIAICGTIEGTTDFDLGTATNIVNNSFNNKEAYVVLLDSAANFQWVKVIPNTSNITSSEAKDVVFTNSGQVYLGGFFSANSNLGDSLNFGSIASSIFKSSNNGRLFVMKLDANGNTQWTSTLCHICEIAAISLDNDGNIFATGTSSGSIDSSDFDPSAGIYPVMNGPNGSQAGFSYNIDGFVFKLKDNGNIAWARPLFGPYNEYPKDIAVATNNNIYIGGHFGTNLTTGTIYNIPDTMDCDPTNGISNLVSINWFDLFLTKWGQNTLSDPLYTKQLIQKEQLELFPNPSSGEFVVSSKENADLIIRNTLGEIVYKQRIIAGNNKIDVAYLQNGVYYVSLVCYTKRGEALLSILK